MLVCTLLIISSEKAGRRNTVTEMRKKIYIAKPSPQLQVKLSLKAELALFSLNPATPPTRESLFSNIFQ